MSSGGFLPLITKGFFSCFSCSPAGGLGVRTCFPGCVQNTGLLVISAPKHILALEDPEVSRQHACALQLVPFFILFKTDDIVIGHAPPGDATQPAVRAVGNSETESSLPPLTCHLPLSLSHSTMPVAMQLRIKLLE